LAAARPGWCATPWGEPSEAEKKIEEALGEPVQLEFIECPLEDVVDYLKDMHQIEIQIDTRALQDVGIADDRPITKNLKGIALRSALNLMLRDVDLTYTLTDEVLLITTPEGAANKFYARVYPVADLIREDDSAARNCEALKEILHRVVERSGRWGARERGLGRPVAEFVIPLEAPGGFGEGLGAPEGFGAPAAPLAPRRRPAARRGGLVPIPPERPKALVVIQNRQGHERAAELLGLLRLAAEQRPGAAPAPIRRVPAAEEKIEQALRSPTQLEFIETPLQDVVDYLKDLHQIEIQIEGPALDDVGIGTDTPITRNLKGISLRSALRLILREVDLTYVIADEVLLITTPEEACCRLYPRVYPVGHLIAGPDDPEAAEREFAVICELIVSVADPVNWAEVGGHGTIVGILPVGPRAAIVVQDRGTHEEVERLLALLLRAAKAGPGSGPIPVAPAGAAEQKIRKALESPTEMEFIDVPLQDVVDYLKHKHGIEIQIDARALEDVGIGTDTPVTRRLKGVSLRSALQLVLRELDLTFVIQDEVLLITTPEEAQSRLLTVLYPIGNLMPPGCEDPKDREAYGTKLVETIAGLVEPATWDASGGPGTAAPLCTRALDLLVVSQTEDVQREIAGLLSRPEFREK
jgi:hypothetical protein